MFLVALFASIFCGFGSVFGSELTTAPNESPVSARLAELIHERELVFAEPAPAAQCSNCGRFGCRTCCLSTVSVAGVVPRPEPVEAVFMIDLDNSLRRRHLTLAVLNSETEREEARRHTRQAYLQNMNYLELAFDYVVHGEEVCACCCQYCPEQCACPRAACNRCINCCVIVTTCATFLTLLAMHQGISR